MCANNDWAISVIIPVYNGAQYLDEALNSALQQTCPPCEIILVDDGSTDDSAALIHQRATTAAIPIHYVYQANQGAGAARNRGIEQAAGQLIAFLDQDDLWLPHKLARQVELLRRMPEAGYGTTQHQLFLPEGMPPPAWVRPERLQGAQAGFLPSCLLVRRETFTRLGVFDPLLKTGNDIDWLARANDAGVIIAVVPEILTLHRVHHGNQSRFVKDNQAEILAAVRKSALRKRAMAADDP